MVPIKRYPSGEDVLHFIPERMWITQIDAKTRDTINPWGYILWGPSLNRRT